MKQPDANREYLVEFAGSRIEVQYVGDVKLRSSRLDVLLISSNRGGNHLLRFVDRDKTTAAQTPHTRLAATP